MRADDRRYFSRVLPGSARYRTVSVVYTLLYRLGITPWDRDEVPGPVKRLADELSAGRALDLGCGTGRDAVFLASRGWAVTAVDAVPQAMAAARQRGADANVDVDWVMGDVTRLESLGLSGAYDFILDRGCFHGLNDDERERYARGVTSAAAPQAELLLFAFQPRRIGLGPRGITPEQLARHFEDGWRLVASENETALELPRWLGDVRPMWYRFERSQAPGKASR
jgi:SAM-dependent methyltransferase